MDSSREKKKVIGIHTKVLSQQTRVRESEPTQSNRSLPKVANVGVHRLRARHRENDVTQLQEAEIAVRPVWVGGWVYVRVWR